MTTLNIQDQRETLTGEGKALCELLIVSEDGDKFAATHETVTAGIDRLRRIFVELDSIDSGAACSGN